jgi:ADP-ribose pyrophosphatase
MDQERQQIEIVDREVVYQGFFRLDRYTLRHSLYAGGMSGVMVRELLERGHAAAVLPYDPVRDEVVLIEQFRIGALEMAEGAWLHEIVAGMIEPGETAEAVVMREAQEEAGCVIQQLEFISRYLVSPGGCSEQISLYCGKIDAARAGGLFGLDEEHEDIRATAVPFAEAMVMLERGAIASATPIIALQWLALHHDRLQERWLSRAPRL